MLHELAQSGPEDVAEDRTPFDKTVNELVSSEKNYVNTLSIILEHYYQPLNAPFTLGRPTRAASTLIPLTATNPKKETPVKSSTLTKDNTPILSPEEIRVLFGNLEQILNLNNDFLQDLLSGQKVPRGEDDNPDPFSLYNSVGTLFLKFVPFFKMYSVYCAEYSNSVALLRELVTSDRRNAFREFTRQAMAKTDNITLASLLICPVQRVPRYILLLKELLKTAPLSPHPVHQTLRKELAEALNATAAVAQHINDEIRMRANGEAIVQLGKLFSEDPLFVAPSRRLVRQGVVVRECRNSNKPFTFFLFNDCLAYADRTLLSNKLKLHRKLPIDDVFRCTDVPGVAHALEIHTTQKTFRMFFATIEQKQEWKDDFDDLIAEMSVRVPQQQAPYSNLADFLHGAACARMVPLNGSDRCHSCDTPFSLLNSPTNCRLCGLLFCKSCAKHKILLTTPKRGTTGMQTDDLATTQELACEKCASEFHRVKRARLALLSSNMHKASSDALGITQPGRVLSYQPRTELGKASSAGPKTAARRRNPKDPLSEFVALEAQADDVSAMQLEGKTMIHEARKPHSVKETAAELHKFADPFGVGVFNTHTLALRAPPSTRASCSSTGSTTDPLTIVPQDFTTELTTTHEGEEGEDGKMESVIDHDPLTTSFGENSGLRRVSLTASIGENSGLRRVSLSTSHLENGGARRISAPPPPILESPVGDKSSDVQIDHTPPAAAPDPPSPHASSSKRSSTDTELPAVEKPLAPNPSTSHPSPNIPSSPSLTSRGATSPAPDGKHSPVSSPSLPSRPASNPPSPLVASKRMSLTRPASSANIGDSSPTTEKRSITLDPPASPTLGSKRPSLSKLVSSDRPLRSSLLGRPPSPPIHPSRERSVSSASNSLTTPELRTTLPTKSPGSPSTQQIVLTEPSVLKLPSPAITPVPSGSEPSDLLLPSPRGIKQNSSPAHSPVPSISPTTDSEAHDKLDKPVDVSRSRSDSAMGTKREAKFTSHELPPRPASSPRVAAQKAPPPPTSRVQSQVSALNASVAKESGPSFNSRTLPARRPPPPNKYRRANSRESSPSHQTPPAVPAPAVRKETPLPRVATITVPPPKSRESRARDSPPANKSPPSRGISPNHHTPTKTPASPRKDPTPPVSRRPRSPRATVVRNPPPPPTELERAAAERHHAATSSSSSSSSSSSCSSTSTAPHSPKAAVSSNTHRESPKATKGTVHQLIGKWEGGKTLDRTPAPPRARSPSTRGAHAKP